MKKKLRKKKISPAKARRLEKRRKEVAPDLDKS